MTDELTLEDLAVRSGLSLRTLRYYMQEGLLPGPDTRGKYARYAQQHLDRLELIRRMKDLHLPLQEIRQLIDNMTSEEMSQLRNYQDEVAMKFGVQKPAMPAKDQPALSSSALDYIHSIRDGRENLRAYALNKNAILPARTIIPAIDQKAIPAKAQRPAKQETWRRIQLADGIELNVRETNDQQEQQQLEQLIQSVKKLITGKYKLQGRK